MGKDYRGHRSVWQPGDYVYIKKFRSNRKYYALSSYVTLDDIAAMVLEGCQIKAVNYPSGEDITQKTLLSALMRLIEQKNPASERLIEAIQSGSISF